MPRIASHLDTASDDYLRNRERMRELVGDLEAELERARAGGGPDAVKRHKRRGKLLARERIERLVDPGARLSRARTARGRTASTTATRRARASSPGSARSPAAPCVIVANDATVKGGTYYPLTVKKHLRAQEIASRTGCPCVYLVDSGGAFLPLQAEVFPDREHFGRIFYNQARMSAPGSRRSPW